MRNIEEFTMADAGREKYAREQFLFEMPPEEYAARYAHEWYCFSFDDYRYPDAGMERWIHRLGDILFQREGAPTVDQLRHRYLTGEEIRVIKEREKEEV